jgi:hypothetical protein
VAKELALTSVAPNKIMVTAVTTLAANLSLDLLEAGPVGAVFLDWRRLLNMAVCLSSFGNKYLAAKESLTTKH